MALEMKDNCEVCGKTLSFSSETYICSYECTYCPECTTDANYVCRTCKGELVRRPKRKEPEKV